MQDDIQEILIDAGRIGQRVRQMAGEIAAAYGQREVLLMPLLTGSIIFLADLVRYLPMRMRIDVLAVSSYRGQATVNQGTRVLYPTRFDVAGKEVLVIDDILDSGRTIQTVCNLLRDQGAAGIRTCVLLKKKLSSQPAARADFVGFEIPDEFVVGYGLDFDGYYRNLPYLAVLHKRIIGEAGRAAEGPEAGPAGHRGADRL